MTQRASDLSRLLAKVNKTETCWLYTGYINAKGYGWFWLEGRNLTAHRAAYLLMVGPIPNGAVIDHLCRVRHCVNPDHLEAVTSGTNVLRGESFSAVNAKKTHCSKGHPFDEENTYRHPKRNARDCRICRRQAATRYRNRKG